MSGAAKKSGQKCIFVEMTLEKWIEQYDVPGAVVLLEGKREVAEADRPHLTALGRLLAFRTRHTIFRSGNAPGSDQLFSEGVASVDPKRLEVITPYQGHRNSSNLACRTYSLDQIDLASEPEVVYQSLTGGRNNHLISRYADGNRDQVSLKAAYLLRDTVKVIGASHIPSASFGIFYDHLENPGTGGTGHTMGVCEKNQVPFINQAVWMAWLAGPNPLNGGSRT